MNMIKILLGTELIVQVGKSRSSIFNTDTGAPQGDCCKGRGQEFTYYLAKSLKEKPEEEHNMQTRNLDKNRQTALKYKKVKIVSVKASKMSKSICNMPMI